MPAATYYGYNPPFYGGPQGILPRQMDERLIKNDLIQLVLTLPGERYARPTFGTSLRASLFDTISEADIAALKSEIASAITSNDDRVAAVTVDIQLDELRQNMAVNITVAPVFAPLTQYLVQIGLPLAPGV